MLVESVSPSGSVVSIVASGLVICQITEFITSKIGGDNQTNSFLSAIITVATSVVAATIPEQIRLLQSGQKWRLGPKKGRGAGEPTSFRKDSNTTFSFQSSHSTETFQF